MEHADGPTANSSDDDLVALAAAGGQVFVSVTQGNTVSVYRINPGAGAAPHLVLTGLGDAIGSDGSIYYERTDHHLAARRPNGAAPSARLADKPNGLGGGVQYLDVVAGGAVWVSEPAGQGLDAAYTTYDAATLRHARVVPGLGHEHAWWTRPPAPSCSSRPAAIPPARRRDRPRRPRASSASTPHGT